MGEKKAMNTWLRDPAVDMASPRPGDMSSVARRARQLGDGRHADSLDCWGFGYVHVGRQLIRSTWMRPCCFFLIEPFASLLASLAAKSKPQQRHYTKYDGRNACDDDAYYSTDMNMVRRWWWWCYRRRRRRRECCGGRGKESCGRRRCSEDVWWELDGVKSVLNTICSVPSLSRRLTVEKLLLFIF